MAAVFQLDVLAASVPFFQGKCVSAVIPVTDGEYGVLAGHSNAVGAVCAGELRFETEDGEHRRAAVAPGLFKIDGDRVLLLLDAAEWPEDIDVNRALRARREAEEESGITGLELDPVPVHVSIHPIQCKNSPPTRHFDVRFVANAPEGAREVISDESLDLAWVPVTDVPEHLSELVAFALDRG